jgi:hypothetical protein
MTMGTRPYIVSVSRPSGRGEAGGGGKGENEEAKEDEEKDGGEVGRGRRR